MPSAIKGAHKLWSGSGGRVETGGIEPPVLLDAETHNRRLLSLAGEFARQDTCQNHLAAKCAAITRANRVCLAGLRGSVVAVISRVGLVGFVVVISLHGHSMAAMPFRMRNRAERRERHPNRKQAKHKDPKHVPSHHFEVS